MSATADHADGKSGVPNIAARLGLEAGWVVQEIGYDDDCDDDLRAAIREITGEDFAGEDTDEVVDAVLLWFREDDGDLVDAFFDILTDLKAGGVVWLMTPKVGRDGYVETSDITEAAPVAGLATTSTLSVTDDWSATKLVVPKSGRRG
ncbi:MULTISPECIES: DUF3052 domain-containing protein [Kribbella]|uniref:DUF3052 domain-containing protein n=2 Tax=Kribbella TaxID=182639 RepID=A0A841DSQ0_9ACTN|nr:DUF3052 family protein [Kribbella solani]MBB5979357.1 hypothetical protein [Kribbella solani]MDX2973030.1 DUF3052 domain-containing protein [Kribbella solani]MDX3003328.1 DUF3052 domain-containing protein [Kribbella solani]